MSKQILTDQAVIAYFNYAGGNSIGQIAFPDELDPSYGDSDLAALDAAFASYAGTPNNPNSLTVQNFETRFVNLGPVGGMQCMFYSPESQKVLVTMVQLWRQGNPPDMHILTVQLNDLYTGTEGNPITGNS